jgi:hypothetical protein
VAIVNFKHYLHEGYEVDDMRSWIEDQISVVLPDTEQVHDNLKFSPFYEVGFNCSIDTETGDIRILGLLT